MILQPDCIICCQRIALQAAKLVTEDQSALKTVVFKTIELLKRFPQNQDTFLLGLKIMEIIEKVTGNGDPYRDIKKKSNEQAESLVSTVNNKVETNPSPLWAAAKATALGNLLDVVADDLPDLADLLDDFLEKPFAVNDFNEFRSVLQRARKAIYMGDNAGETFFDRILIEKMNLSTEYFVKDFPFLNDAQYEDAVLAGIDQVATIKTVRLIKPVIMNQEYLFNMYSDFLDSTQDADLVLVKGQANYEFLMPHLKGAFYVFVHKCPVIAQTDGANIGDAVFLRK